MTEQLDLFGAATTVAATPQPRRAGDQLSLFRPDFRNMRAPKPRGKAAQAAAAAAHLDPDLHGDTLDMVLPADETRCEACAGPIDLEQASIGFKRCETCDPEGRHTAWLPGDPCTLCVAVADEIAARGNTR